MDFEQDQIDLLNLVFSKFDKSGKGKVATRHLGQVLEEIGQTLSHSEVAEMMKEVDKDNRGYFDLPTFLSALINMTNRKQVEEAFKAVFDEFDRDGSGYISTSEFRKAMKRMGEKISKKEAEDFVRAADESGDGKVSFDEFVKTMANKM
ncbi:uncharacterized protein LOC142344024 [Convolutriloba macropyga]|uniref:uncharacterized protein LOC142344024 n=1 Tax=Convolutriloba macropyga TaxID=536237 RepID=UPI003F5232B2